MAKTTKSSVSKKAKANKTNAKSKSEASQKKSVQEPRQLKKPAYKSFRLHKKIKPTRHKLPSSWKLFRRAIGTISRRPKLFLGIALIYGILSLVLVRGFSIQSGLSELKDVLSAQFPGASGQALTASSLFIYMLGSSGSTDAGGSVYQTILFFVVSLATIWALRQAYASKLSQKIRIRDSFYRGMYPLVPFVLVGLVILLELIPVAIGGFLYSTVLANGIAVEFIEKFLFAALFALSVLLSLYLLVSTIFALYVVALPDMTPMRALRSARGLVRYRRIAVLRRLLFLFIFLLIAVALLVIPVILFATSFASWVLFALMTLGLIVAHSYGYALYRELLNE